MNHQAGTIDFSLFEQVDIRVGHITALVVPEMEATIGGRLF
jgi:hypothetical protein